MLKLNDNNMIVGYLKEMLNEFNLPKALLDASDPIDGYHYIIRNRFFLCRGKSLVDVGPYKYGDRILNLTKNLQIRNNFYDAYTHYYLGDYLRFQRDYLGIDLMSLYNCFCYESPSSYGVSIVREGREIDSFSTDDGSSALFMLPVKFGKTYTIGIDCSTSIGCLCDFYDDGQRIDTLENTPTYSSTYRKFTGLRFSKPFNGMRPILFKTPERTEKNCKYEPCLKMFIKIPAQSKSSIVVLEGDYSKGCEMSLLDGGRAELPNKLLTYKMDGSELGNYDYVSRPSLLSINTGEKVLVSDRLIEYVLMNAIAPNSSPANIGKLQDRLAIPKADGGKAYLPYIAYYGIWDEGVRKALYRFISDNGLNSKYMDVLSYMDKDVEKELGGIE